MKHLTVDEIMEFVSENELNDETVTLSAKVNGHIRECEKCMHLVKAFQMVCDELDKEEVTEKLRTVNMKRKLK